MDDACAWQVMQGQAETKGIPGEIAVTRYTADATSTWLVTELL